MVSAVLLQSLLSGVTACWVSSLATYCAIRYGGSIGGIITGSPHSISIYSITIALFTASTDHASQLQDTLYTVAVGEFLCVFIWYIWRILPSSYFLLHYISQHTYIQLIFIITSTLAFWMIGSISYIYIQPMLAHVGISTRAIGITCWLLHLLIAIYVGIFKPIPMPSGISQNMSIYGYIIRGLITGIAIGLSVYLANLNPFVGSLASTAPIFATVLCVTLYVSQPKAVVEGTASATIPALLAFPLFPMVFSECMPIFTDLLHNNTVAAIAVSALLCYTITTCCITFPCYLLLRYQTSKLAIAVIVSNNHQDAIIQQQHSVVENDTLHERLSNDIPMNTLFIDNDRMSSSISIATNQSVSTMIGNMENADIPYNQASDVELADKNGWNNQLTQPCDELNSSSGGVA